MVLATVSSRSVTRLAAFDRSGPVRWAACPSHLADGRTALSQHRRRLSGRRRARRSVRAFLLTTVIAAIAVAGGAKYMISRSAIQADPLAASVVQIPASHTAALLEQQRKHIILMTVATKSFKVVGT